MIYLSVIEEAVIINTAFVNIAICRNTYRKSCIVVFMLYECIITSNEDIHRSLNGVYDSHKVSHE